MLRIGTASVVVFLAWAWSCRPAAGQGFTNVTQESGLEEIRNTRGAGFWLSGFPLFDADGDGDLDSFLGSHHHPPNGVMVLNDGRGRYTLAPANVLALLTSEVQTAYDLDEDGRLDLTVTEGDGGGRWYFNDSAGGALSFRKSNLADAQPRSQLMLDINGDGKVDWLVNGRIYLGDGKGGLTLSNINLGVRSAALPVDIDGDGDKDFIGLLGNAPSSPVEPPATLLYRNDGNLVFTDVTAQAGLALPMLYILGFGDVDADGDMDLLGLENDGRLPLSVFINDGAGHFTKKADAVSGAPTGRAAITNSGAAVVTDLDNDGIGDILVTGVSYLHVLRGTGGGRFVYMNQSWGGIVNTASLPDSGYAFGDLDGDGDLDLLGYRSGDAKTINVYRNDLPKQNWLRVRPIGLPGNKGAAGAKIFVYEAGSNKILWYEEVLIRSKQVLATYYSLPETERHFGLGTRATVDVAVQFFPSQKLVKKEGVAAGTIVRIGEDGNGVVVRPMPPPVQAATDASAPGGGVDARPGDGRPEPGPAAEAGAPRAPSAVTADAGAAAEPMPAPGASAGAGCSCAQARGAGGAVSLWAVLAMAVALRRRAHRARAMSWARFDTL